MSANIITPKAENATPFVECSRFLNNSLWLLFVDSVDIFIQYLPVYFRNKITFFH